MELARRIGDRESEPSAAVDTTAIFLTLYHNHLPRLADADVVEYDRDEGAVYPGLNFDTLVRVLERANRRDLRWSDG